MFDEKYNTVTDEQLMKALKQQQTPEFNKLMKALAGDEEIIQEFESMRDIELED